MWLEFMSCEERPGPPVVSIRADQIRTIERVGDELTITFVDSQTQTFSDAVGVRWVERPDLSGVPDAE